MLKQSLFLVCALALPPQNFIHFQPSESMSAKQFVEQYNELKAFLTNFDPKSEYLIIPQQIHSVPKGYTKLPFLWREHTIYRRAS